MKNDRFHLFALLFPGVNYTNVLKQVENTMYAIFRDKYLRYLIKTNTCVFSILSAITPAKYHLSNTSIPKISFFGKVIYFSADSLCWESAEEWIT